MESLTTLAGDPANWAALAFLIAMEVVLGIDNLIFIAILTNRLPEHQRRSARIIGIGGAVILRLALLGTLTIIVALTTPVVTVLGKGLSWRDIILIGGGLFLVWKATKEIHHRVEPDHGPDMFDRQRAGLGYTAAIGQILILDVVFSLDSIITAVGMTPHIPIMVVAMLVTVSVMLLAATPLSNFINGHPTVVMLALAFLLMIGMVLIAEGFGNDVPKGYLYAAMAFSAFVEWLNMLARRRRGEQQPAPTASQGPGPLA